MEKVRNQIFFLGGNLRQSSFRSVAYRSTAKLAKLETLRLNRKNAPLPCFPAETSDMEADSMCGDEQAYGLEYSEDSNSEPNVDLQNQYCNSKVLKEMTQGSIKQFPEGFGT